MKVVALGRTGLLYDSIMCLKQSGHDIVLIITQGAAPEYTRNVQDFQQLSTHIGCDCIITENLNEESILKMIGNYQPDIAISINWRTLISKEIIDLFPYGIINAHAGDLPRYRGNAVPNWAIIAGESKIGLTLHKMDASLDSGPILLKKYFSISETTTIREVYSFFEEIIPQMYVEVLKGIECGTIRPEKQPDDPHLSLRCYPRMPRDGEIDWSMSAEMIHRLVRAVSEPFAGAYTYIGNQKLIIWKSGYEQPVFEYLGMPGQVAHRDNTTGHVKIVTGDGLLILEEIENVATGERGKPTDIITTIRTRLGMDITEEISGLQRRIKNLELEILKLKAHNG